MRFRKAVEATPDLEDAWRAGLQALRNVDRKYVDAEDTSRLSGSVNLDGALRKKHPNDPVWDYGIGHRPTNREDEVVYWIEIHPATDGEIKRVLTKLDWLQKWLRSEAKDTLHALRREFIWVSSGKTSFTLTSPQQKQFAQKGLQHKGRRFRILNEAAA